MKIAIESRIIPDWHFSTVNGFISAGAGLGRVYCSKALLDQSCQLGVLRLTRGCGKLQK